MNTVLKIMVALALVPFALAGVLAFAVFIFGTSFLPQLFPGFF